MAFLQDVFGKQSLGQILGEVAGAVFKGRDNNANGNNNNNNYNGGSDAIDNSGFHVPVKVGVDKSIFYWIGGLIAGTIILIALFRKKR